MTYAVKEIFLTLQGEGMQAGRRAVFLRLAGCNLWSGREQDRATAQCTFCDTNFVGMDGENGGGAPGRARAGAAGHWAPQRRRAATTHLQIVGDGSNTEGDGGP